MWEEQSNGDSCGFCWKTFGPFFKGTQNDSTHCKDFPGYSATCWAQDQECIFVSCDFPWIVFFTETHTSRSAAGLKKICRSWDGWCATHSNQSASTRAKKLSNKTDRKPTSTPFGYAFLFASFGNTFFAIQYKKIFHDDLFSNSWFLNWWVWGPDGLDYLGSSPPTPLSPGPMCLEGLEEASGESSSESLKKFGPSNLKL